MGRGIGLETMQVVRFSTLEPLAPLAAQWDRLAQGVPFRTWDWISTWWRHYGPSVDSRQEDQLCVLGVIDGQGELIGIAPWYLARSRAKGRVLRFLGAGEVCSDYLTILCRTPHQEAVIQPLADWLIQAAHSRQQGAPLQDNRWDLIELEGVDAEDTAIRDLLRALEARRATVAPRPGLNCWRIPLPASWDAYLAMLSKDHRKRVRRIEARYFQPGRAVLRTVSSPEDLQRAETILVDLHQRRHQALGHPGCYAWPRFAAFHQEVLPKMLRAGRLALHWVELDDVPAAVEYHLQGDDGLVYAYQSGIEPRLYDHRPGALAHMATIQRAISLGFRGFDFLRGDEPYKARWRAVARPSLEIRIVAPRTAARVRYSVWSTGRDLARWVKRRLTAAEKSFKDPESQSSAELARPC